MIITGIVMLAVALYMALEKSSYDKPKNPEYVDTLSRGKTCGNCRHSEISTVFPELSCPVIGRHVDPHHSCKEWV